MEDTALSVLTPYGDRHRTKNAKFYSLRSSCRDFPATRPWFPETGRSVGEALFQIELRNHRSSIRMVATKNATRCSNLTAEALGHRGKVAWEREAPSFREEGHEKARRSISRRKAMRVSGCSERFIRYGISATERCGISQHCSTTIQSTSPDPRKASRTAVGRTILSMKANGSHRASMRGIDEVERPKPRHNEVLVPCHQQRYLTARI